MNQPFVINKRFAVRMTFVFALLMGATVHQTSLQRWQSDLAASQAKATQPKTVRLERERDRSPLAQSQRLPLIA